MARAMSLTLDALRLGSRSTLPFLIGVPLLWLASGAVSSFVEIILITAAINVVLAVSLNVVNGTTGQFSLGHAGFMPVGSYTPPILAQPFSTTASPAPPPARHPP